MRMASPWFVRLSDEMNIQGDPSVRLFCFHYAGADSSVFRSWVQWLSPAVDLIAVEMPGRGGRLGEPLARSMDDLTSALLQAWPTSMDLPFAFLGYSTGASISFEFCRVLREHDFPPPAMLIVVGNNAPQTKRETIRHLLPDREFVDVLRQCDGMPEPLLENRDFLEMLLPRIRADGAVVENHVYEEQEPLNCPIVVMRGTNDSLVTEEGVKGWVSQTRNVVTFLDFPGGHLFIESCEADVLEWIDIELAALSLANA